ncbi:MAG: hypothetical protein JWR34_4328 [Mycobacterium sp.]|nr:hypothetical protein [Mycobacterium sp.]
MTATDSDFDKFGYYCEPQDLLHLDDWPHDVRRPRQFYAGLGDLSGEEFAAISINNGDRQAGLVLNVAELDTIIGYLQSFRDSMTGELTA